MPTATTPESDYEAKLTSVITDAFTDGNLDVIDDVFAVDHSFVDSHGPGKSDRTTTDPVDGREEMKSMIHEMRSAFSDLELSVERIVVDGDHAALWYTMTGTHDGEWTIYAADGAEMTLPATHKPIDASAIVFASFENDEIVESKLLADELTLLEQLDVVPSRSEMEA